MEADRLHQLVGSLVRKAESEPISSLLSSEGRTKLMIVQIRIRDGHTSEAEKLLDELLLFMIRQAFGKEWVDQHDILLLLERSGPKILAPEENLTAA